MNSANVWLCRCSLRSALFFSSMPKPPRGPHGNQCSPRVPIATLSSDAQPQPDAHVEDGRVQRTEERVRGNAGHAVHRRQVGAGEAEPKLAAGPPEVPCDIAL